MSLQLGEVRQDEGGGGRSRLAHCCPGDEGVQVVLTGRGEVQTTGGQDGECKLRYHSLLMNTIPNTKTFFVPFPSLRCCMQVVRVYTYEIQNWTVDPAAEPLHCSSRAERRLQTKIISYLAQDDVPLYGDTGDGVEVDSHNIDNSRSSM